MSYPSLAGRRVLIIVENQSVPRDPRVWHESRSLTKAGAEVTVVCPVGEPHGTAAHEVIDGVAIHRYEPRPASGGLRGYAVEYATALRHIRRLVRTLGDSAPFDAVQACNPPDGMLFAALRERRRGAALVFDHHDLVPELFASRWPNRHIVRAATGIVERMTFKIADVVISTNESFRRVAVGRGRVRAEDVFVVRNGPDLDLFRPPEQESRAGAERPLLIGYLGVMGKQDGIDQALEALALLHSRRADWRAVFVGDGDLLDEMKELSRRLGLDGIVEFTGWCEPHDVVRLIGSADVCLVPDPPNPLTAASSLVKVAEYMALGRAVVAYDLPETRHTTGDTAVFATSTDPAGLAQAVERLLDDPELRATLGSRARARAEQRLSWDRSEQELLAAYEHAFAIAGRRRRHY